MSKVKTQTEKEEPSLGNFLISLLLKSKIFRIRKSFRILALIMVLIFVSTAVSAPGNVEFNNSELKFNTKETKETKETYAISIKEKAELNLVKEVQAYMNKMASGTKLTPLYLINKCQEYNIDIIFVLAQGILESHLGTKGKATRTNSVWNVGTYDNGQILYRYDYADESVDPYLSLLKDRYLIDKNLHNLIQDKGYINDEGNRYASACGYENAMRKLMVRIDMETSIALYQSILNMSNQELIAFFMPTTK